MPRKKRSTNGLPPGARYTSAGRITITFTVERDGVTRRLSQHVATNGSEPKSYGTPEQAMAGYLRVKAYLASDVDRSTTVGGFYADWTNEDHFYWGIGGVKGRSEQTLLHYRSRVRSFAEQEYDTPISHITQAHVERWLENGGAPYAVATISTMFHDAHNRGLIEGHPFAELANEIEQGLRKHRKKNRLTVPKRAQIDAVLARASEDCYPVSLYGWLLTGVRTGMRGGEIDGMKREFLHGNRYHICEQWHYMLKRTEGPKHGSVRDILLPPDVMAVIEMLPEFGNSPYIFNNSRCEHWTHESRSDWWHWCSDGKPSLRQLAGGVTMYNATRHYWASWAVNEAGLSPFQASLLYGHSDGGKLITEVYARPDHEAAMNAALEAWQRTQDNVIDLHSRSVQRSKKRRAS